MIFTENIGFDAGCKERDEAEAVGGCTMCPAPRDLCKLKITNCLPEKESTESHWQKLHSETYVNYPLMPVEQLLGSTREYADFCVKKQLCTARKHDISNRFATSSKKDAHLVLNEDHFPKYVSPVLRIVSDCYVAKAVNRG